MEGQKQTLRLSVTSVKGFTWELPRGAGPRVYLIEARRVGEILDRATKVPVELDGVVPGSLDIAHIRDVYFEVSRGLKTKSYGPAE